MATATSSCALALVAALALASGCGGAASSPARIAAAGDFGAIRAEAPPPHWAGIRVASGATLFYPPRWTVARGDAGTATAVLEGASGALRGYLNLTPRQGGESLANWPDFRLAHNTREGDRQVRSEAIARGVRFRTGRGTCVRDRYATSSGARYVELACLVQGARATSVVVAASPPGAWAGVSVQLYRALSAVTT